MWSVNKTKRDNKRRYSEKTRKVWVGSHIVRDPTHTPSFYFTLPVLSRRLLLNLLHKWHHLQVEMSVFSAYMNIINGKL